MIRSILMAMHKYQPYGGEYYQPILDFQIQTLKKYEDEFDRLYLVDSNWGVAEVTIPMKSPLNKITTLNVNPHLRYYDAYKEVLTQIDTDLLLLMDNDMVVYKPHKIRGAFAHLEFSSEHPDIVSIYDTIGTYQTSELNGKNKFCPYWFATRKDLLMKYQDVEWGPNMPEHETFGKLTEVMLNDGLRSYEFPEDKSNILFDGTQDGEKSKDLGYYHIRAGSTPAYLLAERKYGNRKTYDDYLKNQPKSEILRHLAWYSYMGGTVDEILWDLEINMGDWLDYVDKFKNYHGL
jgi:hypothetical protein